jgi:CRISPR-associated protein Cas8b/Csh1 subtype I-B
MLSPEEFEDAHPPAELANKLSDRPISSVRDLQHLYGRLYTLATAGGGEYASYLTPNESDDLLGEPESLVALKVDLSGGSPALAEDPIYITSIDDELVQAVAHCDYDSAAGIDHSITHRTGQNKAPDAIAGYLVERLTRWATDDDVQSAVEDHSDGWIVEALEELGEQDDIEEKITAAVDRRLEGTTTALTTVMVQLPKDDQYRFPGELDSEAAGPHRTDVFQHAMRARKLAKLISKNEAENSAGQAVDLVTGTAGRTVGTAEDPLNYFLGKQMERFPNFDIEEAWRSHPVSEDSAITLMNAETFIDACSYGTLGARVHYLPYFFGRPDLEKAYSLYGLLYEARQDADLTPVEDAYQTLASGRAENVPLNLRFYVSAIRRQQSKRYDVLGDTMNGSLMYPVELTEAHRNVIQSWIFQGDRSTDRSAPLPTHEDWDLLNGTDNLGRIATGWYFDQTFSRPPEDDDVAADDYRIRALVNTLSGEPLSVKQVLEEFVDRLIDDDYDSFGNFRVASQFVQLRALAAADLLAADDERYESITRGANYGTTQMQDSQPMRADGGANAAVARAEKLESFIESTPSLEDHERRSAFLIGALVGQVSNYQVGSEGRSTTLVDQYPIKGFTVSKVKRIAEEAIDKNIVYSRERGLRGTMYAEIVDALRDALAQSDPDTWEIDTTDLRFYYALGVTYGLNSYAKDADDSAADTMED